MQGESLKVEIIGYDSGWGCRDWGCEDGPLAVAADGILHRLARQSVSAKWRGPLGIKFLGDHARLSTKEDTLPPVLAGVRRLAQTVKNAVENGHIPVVIGGDHTSAIGTWSGTATATGSPGNFGLIWIDAHLDAHTPETAHEGKWGGWWHGQPVSALVGQGLIDLTSIGGHFPKLSPQHMSMIGVHSFEPGEQEFVKRHNIKVFYLEEVQRRGFRAVFEEALQRATAGTGGFGLTVDLDGFCAEDAPGVGTPEGDGLKAAEVLPIIRGLARHKNFKALEIAEFNPHNDRENRTALLVERLIESVFTKD